MEIDAGTMEINGMPYEWVKCKEPVRIKDLNQENLFAELLQSQDSKRAGETCRFLLSLLEQVRQDKDFILKNFHTLAWRLPYYFVGSTVEESREQWDLLGQISKVHDFFGVFQVYVQQCRNVISGVSQNHPAAGEEDDSKRRTGGFESGERVPRHAGIFGRVFG